MFRTNCIIRAFADISPHIKAINSVGIKSRNVIFNPTVPQLYEIAFKMEKPSDPHTRLSRVSSNGALFAFSGLKTGREPQNSRLVKDNQTQKTVNWGKINIPIDVQSAGVCEQLAIDYINHHARCLVVDGYAGWDKANRVKVRTFCTRTYHALFMRNMLIQPKENGCGQAGENKQIQQKQKLDTENKNTPINSGSQEQTIIIRIAKSIRKQKEKKMRYLPGICLFIFIKCYFIFSFILVSSVGRNVFDYCVCVSVRVVLISYYPKRLFSSCAPIVVSWMLNIFFTMICLLNGNLISNLIIWLIFPAGPPQTVATFQGLILIPTGRSRILSTRIQQTYCITEASIKSEIYLVNYNDLKVRIIIKEQLGQRIPIHVVLSKSTTKTIVTYQIRRINSLKDYVSVINYFNQYLQQKWSYC